MYQARLQPAVLVCLAVGCCLLAGCTTTRTTTPTPTAIPSTTSTPDTTNYAEGLRAQYPTEESFTNDNCREAYWSSYDAQKGAAVDVVAQVSQGPEETEDHWVKWQIFAPRTGELFLGVWVSCLTNLAVDRSLLQQQAWIRVQGVVLREPEREDLTSPYQHSRLVIYAEAVESSPEPTTTTSRTPLMTTDSFDFADPFYCLDCGYEWIEDYQRAVDDWYEFGESEYVDDEFYDEWEVPEWWFEAWVPRCPECGSEYVEAQ